MKVVSAVSMVLLWLPEALAEAPRSMVTLRDRLVGIDKGKQQNLTLQQKQWLAKVTTMHVLLHLPFTRA
jgi:BarA-like signal transduction histidine kinase